MFVRILGAVVVALALCVTGCGSEPAPKPSPSATTRTATPTPTPLSMAQYQTALTGAERAVRHELDQVMAARTLHEVDLGRLRLADVMEAKAKELDRLTVPVKARDANEEALFVLRDYYFLREYDKPTADPSPDACGMRSSSAEQLTAAKLQIYWRVRPIDMEKTLGEFTKAGLSFGRQLLPPEPADPPMRNRRAPNGKVLQRDGKRGSGLLRITNGSEQDTVVAVVSGGDPKHPQASIYVRAGSSARLTGLSGTYSVYFKSGYDWDAKQGGFTRGCEYESFLELFTPDSNWKIDLHKTEDGNALTSEVPAF
jgi:hypothetical protein